MLRGGVVSSMVHIRILREAFYDTLHFVAGVGSICEQLTLQILFAFEGGLYLACEDFLVSTLYKTEEDPLSLLFCLTFSTKSKILKSKKLNNSFLN